MIPWEDVVLCNEDHIPFSKKESKKDKNKKGQKKIRKNQKKQKNRQNKKTFEKNCLL